MSQNNNIIGYTLQGQPIYGQIPVQATPRLVAPIPGTTQPIDAQPNPGMVFVNGFIEAKSYRTAPGTNVVLWDSEEGSDLVYIKSTDANGVPQKMRVLRYEDITDTYDGTTKTTGETGLDKETIDKMIEERFNQMFDERFKNRKKDRNHQNQRREDGDLVEQ